MTRSGIDLTALDPDVRPQDDLFAHVNGRWLASHVIPADRAMDGAFRALHDQRGGAGPRHHRGRRRVRRGGDVHGPGRGEGRRRLRLVHGHRRRRGRGRRRRCAPTSRSSRRRPRRPSSPGCWARCSAPGRAAPSGSTSTTTPRSPPATSCTSCRAAWACRTRPTTATRSTRRCSRPTARTSPACCASAAPPRTRRRPTSSPAASLALETELAAGHWDVVKDRDADLTYNALTLTELAERAPGFDWHSWVLALGAPAGTFDHLIVREPSFAEAFAALWASEPLEDWKAWLSYHVISDRAPYLNDELVEANFDFYGRTLTGAQELRDRWKRGVSLVQGVLGEAVGKVYVDRHFPPAHKARMEELVANLVAAYRESISQLDWMGEETRAKALAKLEAFTPKIGYPARWRDYSTLVGVRGRPAGQRAPGVRVRAGPRAGQDRQADRPRRVVHDAADGQRLLQPRAERDRVPGRDPAAAVLRRRGRRRRQLRRDRRRDRPRDRPRVRRPGVQVRRRRAPRGLVDGRRPRRVRDAHQGAGRPVLAVLARPAGRLAPRQRRAHASARTSATSAGCPSRSRPTGSRWAPRSRTPP